MYFLNGYVYGDNPTALVEVKDAKVCDDWILLLTFTTGEKKVFDATILKGQVFEPLKNKAVFENFKIDDGVVTWLDGEIDCSPEYMYNHSYKYDAMAI